MTNIRTLTAEEMKAFMPVRARLLGASGAKSKGYYSEAAFRIKPVAAEGLGTWAVDKHWRLYIDPATLPNGDLGWNVAQCASVFEHELNHLLRDHALRMETIGGVARDTDKSNIATDLEINDDMDADSYVAEIGVLPSKMGLPDNKTAEWYYNNLPSEDTEGDNEDDEGNEDGDDKNEGNQEGNTKPKLGSCGSGAGGKPVEGELEAGSEISPSVSEGEAKIIRQATAQAVKEHQQQHGRGTVSGGLSEWADIELAPPTVPWQKILRSAIRQGVRIAAGNSDYTYTRMSHRASNYRGFAIPAMYSPKPRICVILDTSGSMSLEMISEALNEVQGISKQMGCQGNELTLIQVDAAIGSVKPFTGLSKISLHGRGGTDLRVGFTAAMDMRDTPNVIVCLTDSETPWPEKPIKGVKMVVGVIGDERRREEGVSNTKELMPWATVVSIGNKGE